MARAPWDYPITRRQRLRTCAQKQARRNQGERIGARLRNKEPIERITMMHGQFFQHADIAEQHLIAGIGDGITDSGRYPLDSEGARAHSSGRTTFDIRGSQMTAKPFDATVHEMGIAGARDLARRFSADVRAHFGNRLRDIRLYGSAARGDWSWPTGKVV